MTSDVVCHGVTSQHLFNMHLNYIGAKYNSKVIKYSFRELKYWITREKAIMENGKILYKYDGNRSPYLYALGLGYSDRYSCFNCKFAKLPRQGDITLADYWGVADIFPLLDTSHGVSLLLVNNSKGHNIFDKIKKQIVFYKSSLEDCVKHNINIIHPIEEPSIRKDFYKILERDGYEKMANTILACPEKMYNRRINRIMLLRRLHIYQPYEVFKRYVKFILVKLKLK